jgi:hypothetical protein
VRVPRRLAIHTLIAVGVSFAVVGCGTLKGLGGSSNEENDPRVETIMPPGMKPPKAGDYVLQKPDGTIVYPPGHPLAKTNPGQPASQPVQAVNAEGRVMLVDQGLGFVVLNFTFSRLPPAEQKFFVYRGNQQVGEVVTTSMTDETFLVADINKGDIRAGDIVRPE